MIQACAGRRERLRRGHRETRRAADVRGWIIGGVATLAVAGAVTAGFVLTSGDGNEAGAAPDTTAAPKLVAVERRDLRAPRARRHDRLRRRRAAAARRQRDPDRAARGRRRDRPGHGDRRGRRPARHRVGRVDADVAGPRPGVTDGKDVQQLEYVLTSLGFGEDVRHHRRRGLDERHDQGRRGVPGGPRPGRRRHDRHRRHRVGPRSGPRRQRGRRVGQQLGDAGIEVTGPTQTSTSTLDVADADLAGRATRSRRAAGRRDRSTAPSRGRHRRDRRGRSSTLPVDVTSRGRRPSPTGCRSTWW